MAGVTRLGSLSITFVLLSALAASAPAQRRRDVTDDVLPRVFERAEARHRSARRRLAAILRSQPEFWRELHAVAERLQTQPAWLLNVMATESLFNPAARNPLPGQTASGLLQFIESTARRLGTTTEAIRRMSPLEQLRLVERYLEPFKGRLSALPNVYMAVFRGSIVDGGDDLVVVDSSKEPRRYALNKSLDLNNDKRITKGELGLAALSVGRFLPAPHALHHVEVVNSSSGKTTFVRRKPPQRSDQPARSTRSIYIR